jgi:acetyl esterase/lipase
MKTVIKLAASFLFGWCAFTTSLAQQTGTIAGGGKPLMGVLLTPTIIKPSDNSTSTILDKFSPVNMNITSIPSESGMTLTKDIVFHMSKKSDGSPFPVRMDLITFNDKKVRPCVVYITGGGFMFAPKNGGLYNRYEIAKAGYVVASVEYHVVSNGIYSDAVKDIKAAVRFLRANSEKYGIDAAHVALWGESAGGYLTAISGVTGGIKDFEEGENPERSSAVQACIDAYGLSDLTKIGEDYDDAAKNAHFTVASPDGQYIHGKNSGLTSLDKPEVVAKSNPVNYVDKNDPPFLFLHGTADALVSPSQTLLVHNALLKAGVPSQRYVLKDAGHGGPQFSSPEVIEIMIKFLDKYLK